MKIRQIRFTFATPKMSELQKSANMFASELQEYFKTPFKVTNVTDDQPDELPRMMADPKCGFVLHSSATNMIVEYKNIPDDIDDSFVLDKLSEIVSRLGSVLENYIDAPFNFVGLTANVKIDEQEIGEEPLMYMIKKMPAYKTGNVIDHLESKATFIEAPYFINWACLNEGPIQVHAKDKYSKPEAIVKGKDYLSCVIDINDKYGFLHMKEYESVVESAEGMMDSFIAFYNEKLLSFVVEGEIEHFLK